MGEYAKRKSDGAEIKIGTCENMYYLRYEDVDKVQKIPNSLDPATEAKRGTIRFRLPFPDEDHLRPGDYQDHTRGLRIYRRIGEGQHSYCEDFADETAAEDPGIIQLTHECGLLVNVPCFHGVKLPDGGKDIKAHWNGKSWFLELYQLRPMENGEVLPIVHCRHCSHAWRYSWADVWEYLEPDMQRRFRAYYDISVGLAADQAVTTSDR